MKARDYADERVQFDTFEISTPEPMTSACSRRASSANSDDTGSHRTTGNTFLLRPASDIGFGGNIVMVS
jgi:hypothetical protein